MTTTERIAETPNEQFSSADFFCGVSSGNPAFFLRTSKETPGNSARNTERTWKSIEAQFSVFVSPSCEPTMTKETESPATLVAIIVAARRAGNRELEREMRRQLEQLFRVKLSFVSESNDSTKGVNDAQ